MKKEYRTPWLRLVGLNWRPEVDRPFLCNRAVCEYVDVPPDAEMRMCLVPCATGEWEFGSGEYLCDIKNIDGTYYTTHIDLDDWFEECELPADLRFDLYVEYR